MKDKKSKYTNLMSEQQRKEFYQNFRRAWWLFGFDDEPKRVFRYKRKKER